MKELLHATTVSLILIAPAAFAQSTDITGVEINSVGMRMVPIAAGSFERGRDEPSPEHWDEEPAHKVSISRPFLISDTEVTIEQFQQFRPGFTGSMTEGSYTVGLSWHEAVDFCQWLSKVEGKPYRLPTEAEWEHAARAGTDTPFWSGNENPESGRGNPWGLKNVHSGPLEWCHDWYGPYPYKDQVDPVGRSGGLNRVIRGGGLDRKTPEYARAGNRAAYSPSFAMMEGTEAGMYSGDENLSREPTLEGLIGVWFGTTKFEKPKALDHMPVLDVDWNDFQQPGEDRETNWSARWVGTVVAPADGEITFHIASDFAVHLSIGGKTVVGWEGLEIEKSGGIEMKKGAHYPVLIDYVHSEGERSYLNITWSWPGQEKTEIRKANLFHSPAQGKDMRLKVPRLYLPGHHSIGFRVVQAALPGTEPLAVEKPFFRECVVQSRSNVKKGPDAGKPWYRRRALLPIPPTYVPWHQSRAVGLPKGFRGHIHNAGLAVCPNGDILVSLFTSKPGPQGEDQPEVMLIGSRLRFGAAQWDMPDVFVQYADVNTTSPCFYLENGNLNFYFGHTYYNRHYPFQWITSSDNGASWSEVRFPQITNEIGPHTPQPIMDVFRDLEGTLYVPTDGYASSSVLWASRDDGRTWTDTGGRTHGRHTSFQMLKDGRILGMGGKKSNIDGYMPKSISADGGKTWQIGKTPFSELGSGQRPSLIRLQSGRLFFCGDFQHRTGRHPEGIEERGAYVALSDDEGETWQIKQLPGALNSNHDNLYPSLGYAVAKQAPNGIIHIVASKSATLLHFEINEAWILDKDARWSLDHKSEIVETFEDADYYSSGKLKAIRRGGITTEGEYLLHGRQVWYYEDGSKQWEVTFVNGRKLADETFWNDKGEKLWSWTHRVNGSSDWTQYWPNGNKKSESTWINFKAEGPAAQWDRSGKSISHHQFWNGHKID